MKKRIISLILVLSLMAPVLVVPTSAVAALPGGVAAGASSVFVSSALASKVNDMIENTVNMCEVDSEQVQAVLDYLVSVTGVGNLGHEGLQSACNRLNQIAANPMKYAKLMYEDALVVQGATVIPSFELFYKIFVYILSYQNDLVEGWHIINHQSYGYVIVNQSESFVLCDSFGRYPYAEEITDKWLGSRTALESSSARLATDYMLDNLQGVHEALHPDWSFRQISVTLQDGKYLVLQAAQDGVHYDSILCDENGFPYGVSQSPTQAGSDRDYNNDKPDQPEVSDEPIVDIDGDLVMQMFPDGSWTWINSLTYDASSKTYNIDASSTYNTENNTYNTYNFHYEYHIDYTSITYIGATEEFTQVYEYYYDLPDGRSSADLTAEELLALNVAVDVVPYIRSSDNTSLRRLFHFDGNVRDASYWNYSEGFEWVSGASITYMESNAFNGCLYLDETAHEFNVITPSSLGSRDFTLQFRYYQSHTPTPQTDSHISISGVKVLEFTGGAFLFNGNSISTPIGSWNEIALIRENGVLYFYLNGVCEGLAPMSSVLGKTINFVLGDKQQTYKQLDEMRILDYALVSKAEQYTPTSVPYDTNLALVLPDSMTPVADEYWNFNAQNNIIPFYDFTEDNTAYIREGYQYGGGVFLTYDSRYASFDLLDGSTVFSRKVSTNGSWMEDHARGAFTFQFNSIVYPAPRGMTFSILLADGTHYSVDPSGASSAGYKHEQTPDGGYIGMVWTTNADDAYICVPFFVPPYGSSWEIVYAELVEGSTPNTGHEFVSAIAPVNTDFKTPTLAVRTDIDITGYQLGGVRPSLPEEGLVWGMVEDGRITSLQIYNGQAWEQVDGRIWTGSRWVPYYAYDIVLLKDLYDIVESDPSLDYIYTEAGFWKWLQSAWNQMMAKLEEIRLAVGGGSGTATGVQCTHAYALESEIPATCVMPGQRDYVCPVCGGQYIEALSPLGHDWIAISVAPDTYSMPDDVVCPDCGGSDFAFVLNEADAQYTCTCNSCSKEWTQNAVLEKGNTTYECSLCGETYVGTDHPDASGGEDNWTFIDLLKPLKDGVWNIVKGVVSTGVGGFAGFVKGVSKVGGFFDAYDPDTSGGVLDIMNVGSSAVWD